MTIEELKQVEFTICNLFPSGFWDCIRRDMRFTLAECDYPDLPASKFADCKPWVGRNVLVQHVIVRVGYQKEPLDMPYMLIAQRIAHIAKIELGIADLFETFRKNSYDNTKYFSTTYFEREGEIAHEIVRMFQPLVRSIRGEWQDNGKVERKMFGIVLSEPHLVTLNGIVRRQVGIRYPGSTGGYWDPDGYEGPTFSPTRTYQLLTCNQSVLWSPTDRQTSLMVHPADILQEVPEANEIHRPRMDQRW